jgi:competence protein ComEA
MFGGFKSVDELTKVKGIGAKTVEKNRRRLSVQD